MEAIKRELESHPRIKEMFVSTNERPNSHVLHIDLKGTLTRGSIMRAAAKLGYTIDHNSTTTPLLKTAEGKITSSEPHTYSTIRLNPKEGETWSIDLRKYHPESKPEPGYHHISVWNDLEGTTFEGLARKKITKVISELLNSEHSKAGKTPVHELGMELAAHPNIRDINVLEGDTTGDSHHFIQTSFLNGPTVRGWKKVAHDMSFTIKEHKDGKRKTLFLTPAARDGTEANYFIRIDDTHNSVALQKQANIIISPDGNNLTNADKEHIHTFLEAASEVERSGPTTRRAQFSSYMNRKLNEWEKRAPKK